MNTVVLAGIGPVGPVEIVILSLPLLCVWAGWRVCERVGRPGASALLLVIPVIGLIFALILLWDALPRAGYTRWLSLGVVIPFVALILLFVLAFQRWPESRPIAT